MNEWMAAHHTANISVNNNYNIKATTWWIHLVWWLVYFLRCIFSHFPLFRPSCVIHSPLFSPISVPVVSHLCIILSIFHSLGGRGSSNEWFSVFLVLSARLFSSSHAPFGCWSLAGNSILSPPLSGRHFALISSPSDAERRKFGQANGKKSDKKKSTKKSTKNSENETKNLQNSSPMCFPFWFLFGCGHWIVFSHFACLFPLLSCSLNSKKKKKILQIHQKDPTSEHHPILKFEWNWLK